VKLPGIIRRLARPALRLAALAALLLTGLACGGGGRFVVLGTARAPSTSGIIEVDDLDGGNTLVTVHLEHLHPPDRLADGLQSYVVWFQGPGGSPIRAGELRYDSEARTGDLAETAPFTHLVVSVTAETDAEATQPSDYVVASHEISVD
jgi:hypothetical protein